MSTTLSDALRERARLSMSPNITSETEVIFSLGYLIGCLPVELEQEIIARLDKLNQADRAKALA
jgi:hypothetical protein